MIVRRAALLAATCLCAWACSESKSPTDSEPSEILTNLQMVGSPEAQNGATWTYRATTNGVTYDLSGILFKPAGNGPFPAVIISHGAGGNANGYARSIARTMVTWGLVCIATNYTHAGGVTSSSPGTNSEPGASQANINRAYKLLEILAALGYVDQQRVAAHGHSMGAFVTAALAGSYPQELRVVSHTAGGVRPQSAAGAAPLESQVTGIRAPYQMHHGDADLVVALSADQRLATLLSGRNVVNELVIYPGADHDDVALNSVVLDRIRAWYTLHGLF